MHLTIGQKVAYPNQGVCQVEAVRQFVVAGSTVKGYTLRAGGAVYGRAFAGEGTDAGYHRQFACVKGVDDG